MLRSLALLALLPAALAYGPGTGSSVAGNLSAAAPWGIPPDKFASATKDADASASFNMTGYNVSSGAPSPQSAAGWKLTAHVKDDVSLSDAVPPSGGQVSEATTLYIEAPSQMSVDPSWRMCAVVYPGVASAVAPGTTVDGTCGSVLSSGCAQALQVSGLTGKAGMDSEGNCMNFALPSRCSGDFPAGTGNVSAVGKYPLPFFLFLSAPRPLRTCLSEGPWVPVLPNDHT